MIVTEIDYSLAPTGATHTTATSRAWRKIDKSDCMGYCWLDGEWRNRFYCYSRASYNEIPNQEYILNDLADKNTLISIQSIGISKQDVEERRRVRIEAGLIDATEDGLSWLDSIGFPPPSLDVIDGAYDDLPAGYQFQPCIGGWRLERYGIIVMTWDEWQKRRGEPEPAESSESSEWVDGLPPIGAACEISEDGGGSYYQAKVEAYSRDKSGALLDENGVWICVTVANVLFMPIETKEQKSKRERKEAIESLTESISSFIIDESIPLDRTAGVIVEWLMCNESLKVGG